MADSNRCYRHTSKFTSGARPLFTLSLVGFAIISFTGKQVNTGQYNHSKTSEHNNVQYNKCNISELGVSQAFSDTFSNLALVFLHLAFILWCRMVFHLSSILSLLKGYLKLNVHCVEKIGKNKIMNKNRANETYSVFH